MEESEELNGKKPGGIGDSTTVVTSERNGSLISYGLVEYEEVNPQTPSFPSNLNFTEQAILASVYLTN